MVKDARADNRYRSENENAENVEEENINFKGWKRTWR